MIARRLEIDRNSASEGIPYHEKVEFGKASLSLTSSVQGGRAP